MPKIKSTIAKFLLYVYLEYIIEEWDCYTPIGRVAIYPLWFARSLAIWLICPIFIFEYLFKKTNLYKEITKATETYYKPNKK